MKWNRHLSGERAPEKKMMFSFEMTCFVNRER